MGILSLPSYILHIYVAPIPRTTSFSEDCICLARSTPFLQFVSRLQIVATGVTRESNFATEN